MWEKRTNQQKSGKIVINIKAAGRFAFSRALGEAER